MKFSMARKAGLWLVIGMVVCLISCAGGGQKLIMVLDEQFPIDYLNRITNVTVALTQEGRVLKTADMALITRYQNDTLQFVLDYAVIQKTLGKVDFDRADSIRVSFEVYFNGQVHRVRGDGVDEELYDSKVIRDDVIPRVDYEFAQREFNGVKDKQFILTADKVYLWEFKTPKSPGKEYLTKRYYFRSQDYRKELSLKPDFVPGRPD